MVTVRWTAEAAAMTELPTVQSAAPSARSACTPPRRRLSALRPTQTSRSPQNPSGFLFPGIACFLLIFGAEEFFSFGKCCIFRNFIYVSLILLFAVLGVVTFFLSIKVWK